GHRDEVPEAARCAGEGPARSRLEGGEPEGVDVRLGEDPGTLSQARLAGVHQEPSRAGEGLGLSGRGLRRVRRRARAVRDDRERTTHKTSDPGDQTDVSRRRALVTWTRIFRNGGLP